MNLPTEQKFSNFEDTKYENKNEIQWSKGGRFIIQIHMWSAQNQNNECFTLDRRQAGPQTAQ